MSIIITNVTPERGLTGVHEYEIRVNNGPVLARFEHRREEGMGECLRKAWGAYEKNKWTRFAEEMEKVANDASTQA